MSLFRRTALAATVVFALMPSPVRSDTSVDQAVEQFYRTCLVNGPDFERMIEIAHERRWTLIAEGGFAELAPVADPTSVEAWLAAEAEEGLPAGTIIGTTRATLNGKPVQTCTLAFPDVDQEAFRESFFARTDAEKIAEDRDTEQLSRLYILIAGGRKQFVRLVVLSSAPPGTPRIVASSITAD
ncbi:MAG: hypothetical protein E5Y67_07205 [Mesorhizobium sp.]|uniref:hypothetical protein n=1 Tax=Mesorhizobium sp. TaxID=1871066 RepID=UPI00121C5DA8|nr:hypothetical protein [Mesorhizobium sp.]TIM15520.1 MAG: hypothetical protein E5Y67_07205 [Mesorhizobium sp.]